MLKNQIIALLLLMFAGSSSHSSTADVVLIKATFNSKATEYSVPMERAEKIPKWKPAHPNIPLSPQKAAEKAQAWLKVHNPKIDSFEPYRIELAKAMSGGVNDLWYYTVAFVGTVGDQRMFGGGLQAVVLMDGSIVEPRLEKQDIRCSQKC